MGTATTLGGDQPFRHVLVERRGQRQRVGAGVGDAQHLQDGRHPRLARRPTPCALGHVPDEVGRVVEDAWRRNSRPSPRRTTSWPRRAGPAMASTVSGLSNSSYRSSGPSRRDGPPARGRSDPDPQGAILAFRGPGHCRRHCHCRCRLPFTYPFFFPQHSYHSVPEPSRARRRTSRGVPSR